MIAKMRQLVVLFAAGMLGACVSVPDRLPATALQQESATLEGYQDIRFDVDASAGDWTDWRETWLAQSAAAGRSEPLTMLTISSGSDEGAFAAGLLNGWSEAGKRPSFDVVVGVSTGALVAPLAFLGPEYDDTLRFIYTGISGRDIFRARPIQGLLGGSSMASNQPLRDLVEKTVTLELVDAIAKEHRAGRRLLALTTNLDAQKGVVWDIGEIASSSRHDKIQLIHSILMASSSIPGLFPPELIKVEANGHYFSEAHVDGAVTSSFFVLPTAILNNEIHASTPRIAGGSVDIIYNGALRPLPARSELRTFSLIDRAMETMILINDQTAIRSLTNHADNNGISVTLWQIAPDQLDADANMFDQHYMMKLFEHGRTTGVRSNEN